MFKYGDKVIIIDGFFIGAEGIIIDEAKSMLCSEENLYEFEGNIDYGEQSVKVNRWIKSKFLRKNN